MKCIFSSTINNLYETNAKDIFCSKNVCKWKILALRRILFSNHQICHGTPGAASTISQVKKVPFSKLGQFLHLKKCYLLFIKSIFLIDQFK